MLLQFSVQNFLSFKDSATLSLVAAKRKSKDRELDLNAIHDVNDELRVLKAAIVYGANNSGKSNLIKALRFLRRFVLDSSRESTAQDAIQVSPFLLSTETENAPSQFEVIFIQEQQLFQYELSVSKERVVRERLTRKALTKHASPVELFLREDGHIKANRTSFKEGRGLESKTRPNALFLSVCANFDGPISTAVLDWFGRLGILSGLGDLSALSWTVSRLQTDEYGAAIQALLRAFDLGIERFEKGEELPGLTIQSPGDSALSSPESGSEARAMAALLKQLRLPVSHQVITYHKVFDESGQAVKEVAFDLHADESEGTKKLLAMAGPLIDSLRLPRVMVVDELESRLHTNLSRMIIALFNSRDANPLGAQLIAATHDTNLLAGDQLRRDQIWFAGRDGLGRSSLTSLVEFKVRNDASFEKGYLAGDYGGTPFARPELAKAAIHDIHSMKAPPAKKHRAS